MKMDILNALLEKGTAFDLGRFEEEEQIKDFQYLIRCIQEMLNSANTLFNFASDQDLVEIAIYQQILAEKWLNYLYKLMKKNPQQ